jgi:hypothetical protein
LTDKSEVVGFGVVATGFWIATFSTGSGVSLDIVLIFIPRLWDFLAAAESFLTSTSRTVSFIIAPQLGQIDKVTALFRLQTGQFIKIKRFKNSEKNLCRTWEIYRNKKTLAMLTEFTLTRQ